METENPNSFAHGRQVPFGDPRLSEDPVTGEAAGCVAAYLVRNNVILAAPNTSIIVEQGNELGRPGRVEVEVKSREGVIEKVKIGGPVVHVGFGRFEI